MIGWDALVRLCPPPGEPRAAVDWAGAERALGTGLPADYKELVDTYGDGVFADAVWLLVPGSAHPDCDLLAQAAAREEILGGLWEFEAKPAGLEEAGARVLPWAYEEETGAFLYWLAGPGRHPDEWTVLYDEGRGPLWEPHATGCVPFLLAVLGGTAESAYFDYLREGAEPPGRRFTTADEAFGRPTG
ncbi:SMI1/KNR4 family protein [Streptomyces globosus]